MEPVVKIEGIDTISALNRIGGDVDFYRKLLCHFVAEQTETGLQIEPLLIAGDRKTAKRIVHSTKGIAAIIGADALAEVASLLEEAIQDKKEDDALLRRFSDIAASIITAIQQALPNAKMEKLETEL